MQFGKATAALALLLLLLAERRGARASSAAPHPAANHRGVWTAAPRRTPSSMVPDGPIAANGDMGVGIGNAAHGNQSYYFGKMDFWSSNAFDGSRFEWTHVAPAYLELSFASVLAVQPAKGYNHSWSALQELYEPMLNTTIAAGTDAEVHTSAVFAPETNVMAVRLRSAKKTTLSLRLSTQLPSACAGKASCMAELPMEFATTTESDSGAALTMTREANHWVNNEAVLVECDPELIPTMGVREFDVSSVSSPSSSSTGSGGISLRSQEAGQKECLALLPAEGKPYPASVRHPPTTDHIVSKGPCSSSAAAQVRENEKLCFPRLTLKMISLPRQARDRIGKVEKGGAFPYRRREAAGRWLRAARSSTRVVRARTSFLSPSHTHFYNAKR